MSGALDGRLAVVTGASQGIGCATALAWARAGADIVAAARNLPKLEQLAAAVRELGRRCEPVVCDVADDTAVARLKGVAEAMGEVDILFNCAGSAGLYAALMDTPLEVWDRTVAVNLRGTFLCCQAFVPGMTARRRGVVINVSSSDRALPLHSAYHATKFGVVALTQALAEELRDSGVSVNAVRFGVPVDTELAREVNGDRHDYENWQQPEDVTEVLTLLASQLGTYVTGGYINLYEWRKQLGGPLPWGVTPYPAGG